ncbi:MAG TPA: extracellular solute-binding protein [Armatimonadota bacterium]|nr:extracellular solute-binding protein [Armatimonadota bacterium]
MLGLLVLLVLAGCGRERSVVVYTAVDQMYAEPIFTVFEQQSGIKVLPVYDVEATKTTGLVNRLIAEKSSPQADVWWNNEFAQTLQLKAEGALEAYPTPAAASIPERYMDPDGYWTGMPARARVIIVNTDLVDEPNWPNSREDLLDPKWGRGQVGIAYPLFGTTATEAAALYATLGPEEARDYYQNLAASGVRVVDGNSVVRDLVADGQLKLGLTDTDDAWGALRRGAPVKVIVPDQDNGGTLVIPGSVALVAGAPHPTEARKLIDYLASEQVERAMIESDFCQIPMRLTDLRPDWLPGEGFKTMDVSFERVYEQLPAVQHDLREIFVR